MGLEVMDKLGSPLKVKAYLYSKQKYALKGSCKGLLAVAMTISVKAGSCWSQPAKNKSTSLDTKEKWFVFR
eukprot:1160100-Pelagomonas_calceolata.AAC.2